MRLGDQRRPARAYPRGFAHEILLADYVAIRHLGKATMVPDRHGEVCSQHDKELIDLPEAR
jgi:hypothetical protein